MRSAGVYDAPRAAVVGALDQHVLVLSVLPDDALLGADRVAGLLGHDGQHAVEHDGRGDGAAGVEQRREPRAVLVLAMEHVGVADRQRRGAADRLDRAQLVAPVAARAPIDELDGAEGLAGADERHGQQARPRRAPPSRRAARRRGAGRRGRRSRAARASPGRCRVVGHCSRLKLCAIQTPSTSPSYTPARQRSASSVDDVHAADRRLGDLAQPPARRKQHLVDGERRREQRARFAHHGETLGRLPQLGVHLRVHQCLGGVMGQALQQIEPAMAARL